MRRNRIKSRKYSIIFTLALFIVACVSIGFASFSNTLTISSSVIVTPDEDSFKVEFSSSETEVLTDPIVATGSSDVIRTDAIITNGSTPTLSNINVTFPSDGKNVLYRLYAHNTGQYDAYLTDIIFNNVPGHDSPTKCTALEGTNQETVDAICDRIYIRIVAIGVDSNGNSTTVNVSETTKLTNHILKKGTSGAVRMMVTYSVASDSLLADGDFTVEFGDISLVYSTVDKYK